MTILPLAWEKPDFLSPPYLPFSLPSFLLPIERPGQGESRFSFTLTNLFPGSLRLCWILPLSNPFPRSPRVSYPLSNPIFPQIFPSYTLPLLAPTAYASVLLPPLVPIAHVLTSPPVPSCFFLHRHLAKEFPSLLPLIISATGLLVSWGAWKVILPACSGIKAPQLRMWLSPGETVNHVAS